MCTGTRLRYTCECVEYHYSSRCIHLGCPAQTNEALFPNFKINTPCPNHMNSYQKSKYNESRAVYRLPSDIQALSAKLDQILESSNASAVTNGVSAVAATTTPIRTPCMKVDKPRGILNLNENSPTRSPRKKVRFSGTSFQQPQVPQAPIAAIPVQEPVPPPIIKDTLSKPSLSKQPVFHAPNLDKIAKDIITVEIDTQLTKLYQKLRIYTAGSRDHLETVSTSVIYGAEERKAIVARTCRYVDDQMEELFDDAMENMAEAVYKEVRSKLMLAKEVPVKEVLAKDVPQKDMQSKDVESTDGSARDQAGGHDKTVVDTC